MMRNVIKAVSLFSGAGGMDVGFESAGYKKYALSFLRNTILCCVQNKWNTKITKLPCSLQIIFSNGFPFFQNS